MLRSRASSGFTLIEIMIVVAIIGALAALAIPQFQRHACRAKSTEAKIMLRALYEAQLAHHANSGAFTAQLADLDLDLAATSGPRARVTFYDLQVAVDASGFSAEAIGHTLRLGRFRTRYLAPGHPHNGTVDTLIAACDETTSDQTDDDQTDDDQTDTDQTSNNSTNNNSNNNNSNNSNSSNSNSNNSNSNNSNSNNSNSNNNNPGNSNPGTRR